MAQEKITSIPKVTRPALSGALPRERLFHLLDQGRTKSVIWIHAPAGSGKTVLAASYLEANKLSSLWYQLDSGDGDMASFFYYLGFAAQKLTPEATQPLPLLTPEYCLGLETFTRRYFEQLCTRLKPPLVMVFDDYQQVPEKSIFHHLLGEMVISIPQGINLVFVSRHAPPPSMAKFQARQDMDILGWDELQFSLKESKELIQFYGRRKFSLETIRQLHHTTRGWAAGLILFLNRRKGEDLQSHSSLHHTPQEIFDYYAGEILSREDKETQDFLLKTGFLPKITPPLARELTGRENSHALLLKLARQNYFLETRFTPDLSYQYHPLFREFLAAKAEVMLGPGQVKRLQSRTADLLEAHGHIEDAAQICSEIGAYEKLAQLTCKEAPHLIRQGRSQTLERRLNTMPQEMIDKTPWLLFWQGVCVQSRDPVEGRSYFEKAYRLFLTNPDQNLKGLYLCLLNGIDTFYLARGRVAALSLWVKKLEDLIKLYPKAPSKEIEERIIFSMGGAILVYLPEHPGFSQWEKKLEAFIYSGVEATMRMMIGFWFITYYVRTGEYAKVKIILDRLKPDKDFSHFPPILVIIWHEWQAAYCMISGRSHECQKYLEQGFSYF